MTGEKYKLVLNMFTSLLSSHWPHNSKYVNLVAKLGICSYRGHNEFKITMYSWWTLYTRGEI